MGGVCNTPNFQFPRTPCPPAPSCKQKHHSTLHIWNMFGPLSVSLSTGVSDLISTADLFTIVNCRKTTVIYHWEPPNIMGKYIKLSPCAAALILKSCCCSTLTVISLIMTAAELSVIVVVCLPLEFPCYSGIINQTIALLCSALLLSLSLSAVFCLNAHACRATFRIS